MEIITLPEDLGISGTNLVGVYNYETTSEITNQQVLLTHNTFSFLTQGTKQVVGDQGIHAIDNSEFLLMKSGPCLMTERVPETNQTYKSLLLFFNDVALRQFVRNFEINDSSKSETHRVQAFHYDTYAQLFITSFQTLLESKLTLTQDLIQLKFEEIMLYLVKSNGPEFIFRLLSSQETQSSSLIRTVENNRLNRLSLKELAFLSNMSVSSFKRNFEKHYNTSPSNWFQEQRLNYAADLLKEGKRSSDIYLEVGYESLSSFTQAFKEKFGFTPKKFQND
jgi:AraC-like DNA-binding protein